jgi:hypothetical protein
MVYITYRYEGRPGRFGVRREVVSRIGTYDEPDVEEVATMIWFTDVEDPPPSGIPTVDGVRWWGDPPAGQ